MIQAGMAAAGAGVQLFGAIQGASQARAAAQAQARSNEVSMAQYITQRRDAQLQQQAAADGSTDARGNRTRFIPGLGTVVELADGTRQLINASDQEEYLRNTSDAADSRVLRQLAARRGVNEGAQADAALAQGAQGTESIDAVHGNLALANVAQAMSGNNATREAATMQRLRQGSGGERLMAELSRNGQADTRTALANARRDAAPEFMQRNNARESNAANLYNMFASRATNPVGGGFQPTSVGMAGEQAGGRVQAAMAQAAGNVQNIRAPQMGFTEDRTPVAIAGLGAALSSGSRLLGEFNTGKRTASGATFDDTKTGSGRYAGTLK